jgi:hypothetical protein
MADKKRDTIRYELAGDDTPYLSLTSPAPPYSSLRKVASTSNLAHAVELPAEPAMVGSSPSIFANFLGNNIKTRGILSIWLFVSLLTSPIDDARVDIDCDSKLVRSLTYLS